jgi:Fe-S cluster assembly iron-binding protein IscA
LGVALDEPKDDDTIFSARELQLHVEKRIALFADNTVIDYVRSWFGEGFVVKPAYGGSC